MTLATIGIETPWAWARASIAAHEATPSAVWWVTATTSSTVSPLPRLRPNVELRECGDRQVTTRSPTPARPAKVAGCAPIASPSARISLKPLVITAAVTE